MFRGDGAKRQLRESWGVSPKRVGHYLGLLSVPPKVRGCRPRAGLGNPEPLPPRARTRAADPAPGLTLGRPRCAQRPAGPTRALQGFTPRRAAHSPATAFLNTRLLPVPVFPPLLHPAGFLDLSLGACCLLLCCRARWVPPDLPPPPPGVRAAPPCTSATRPTSPAPVPVLATRGLTPERCGAAPLPSRAPL